MRFRTSQSVSFCLALLLGLCTFLSPLLVSASSEEVAYPEDVNSVYQYFVPDTNYLDTAGIDRLGRLHGSYLWIPPQTTKVKGIIISIRNMIETNLMESPMIRKTCEEFDLGILMLQGGGDSEISKVINAGNDLRFRADHAEATAAFEHILARLADVSGHPELIHTNFIPTGHSARMDWAFDIAYYQPDRTLASIPLKAGVPGRKEANQQIALPNIPMLFVQGSQGNELAEGGWGTMQLDQKKLSSSFNGVINRRAAPYEDQIGILWNHGGHTDLVPEVLQIVDQFLRKAVSKRLPANATDWDGTAPMTLNDLPKQSGWLADLNVHMDKGYKGVAPYNDYIAANGEGSQYKAGWYIDEELAKTCIDYMKKEYRNAPQMITGKLNGVPIDHPKLGTVIVPPDAMRTGEVTLDAEFYRTVPQAWVKASDTMIPMVASVDTLTNSGEPIKYRLVKGPFVQVADNRFLVHPNRFYSSIGENVEVWFIAYATGNQTHTFAARPFRIQSGGGGVFGPTGKKQTITFPDIEPVSVSAKEVELQATSSSGLPVDYFVDSGPAAAVGSKLKLLQVPESTRYPIEIRVAAYAKGNQYATEDADGGYKAAPPVYKTLLITAE